MIIIIQAVKNIITTQHPWHGRAHLSGVVAPTLSLSSYFVPSNKTGNLARRSSSSTTNSTLLCVRVRTFVEAFLYFFFFWFPLCLLFPFASFIFFFFYITHTHIRWLFFFVALAS